MHRFHIFDPRLPTTPLASAETREGAFLAMRTMAGDAYEAGSTEPAVDYALVVLDEPEPASGVGGDVDVYRVHRDGGRTPRLIGYALGTLAPILVSAAREAAGDNPRYASRGIDERGARRIAAAHQPPEATRANEGGSELPPALPDGPGHALRFVYVRDVGTLIPAMVVIPHRAPGNGRRVAWRAGYAPETPYAIVTDLLTLETQHDPFVWRNATMGAFHRLILDGASTSGLCTLAALASMPDGQEVNVELYREAMARRT